MKIIPLPEIDLARIAVMPEDLARRALRQLKLGYPPYSYDPLRKSLPDILNVEYAMLGKSKRTPWATIAARIASLAKTEAENDANQAVGEALFAFSVDRELRGRHHEFYPLAVGLSTKVSFWSKAVLSLAGGPIVTFMDPRKTKGLTSEARRFVFSAMHERIRASDEDFAAVRLGIFQFPKGEEGARLVRLTTDENVELFSFGDIDDMVRTTYRLWQEVLEEREHDRRRSTGTRGPLI